MFHPRWRVDEDIKVEILGDGSAIEGSHLRTTHTQQVLAWFDLIWTLNAYVQSADTYFLDIHLTPHAGASTKTCWHSFGTSSNGKRPWQIHLRLLSVCCPSGGSLDISWECPSSSFRWSWLSHSLVSLNHIFPSLQQGLLSEGLISILRRSSVAGRIDRM